MNRSLQVRPSWILEPQSLPCFPVHLIQSWFACFSFFTPDLPVSPFSLLICQIFSWNGNHNFSNFSLYVSFASLRGHCSLDFLWLPPEATILTAAGITSFQICWSSTGKTNEQFKPWCYKNRFFLLFKVFFMPGPKKSCNWRNFTQPWYYESTQGCKKKTVVSFFSFFTLRFSLDWERNIKGVH